MSKEAMKLALGKIKSARECHPNAVDALLFEAEEILEEALAEQPAQQEPVTDEENEKFSRDVSGFKGADPEATKYALEEFLRNRVPAIGDIRALKHRIHALEGDVIGYKQLLDAEEQPAHRAVKTYHDGKPAQEQVAAALERIAQEPPVNGNNLAQARVLMAAQRIRNTTPPAQQEPFCWCIESVDSADWCFAATKKGVVINSLLMDEQCVKSEPFALYAAPPAQRTWVGLTDEEIKRAWHEAFKTDVELTAQLVVYFARATEAKLKEKNT